MKSKEYCGLGITEKEVFRTLDNGKTWENVTDGIYGDIYNTRGRIIFGSDENGGLTYSDDAGKTIEQSNVIDGNWNNIIYSKDGKTVFSSSADKLKIAASKDNGETWDIIINGSDSNNNENETKSSNNDGKIYGVNLFGDDVTFDNGNLNININNSGIGYSSGKPTVNLNDIYGEPNGLLLFMLNNVLAPKFFMEVTGKKIDRDSKAFVTLKNISNTFYANKNTYINNDTLLDFEEDVGMKPFYKSLDSIVSDEENIILNNPSKEDTETMKKTMAKVRAWLKAKKERVINDLRNKIENTIINNENFLDIEGASKEDLADAVEMEKMYEGVVKGSSIFVISDMYERIFSFPDSKIRELIFAGIFEELKLVSGPLNMKILKVLKDYEEGSDLEKDLKNINIKYSLVDGIKIALNKYMGALSFKIKEMTENEDEDLKSIAITNYKENRYNYMQQAEAFIYSLDTSSDFYIDIFKELNDSLEKAENNPDFKTAALKILNDFNNKFTREDIDNFINIVYSRALEKIKNINIVFSNIEPNGLQNKDFKTFIKYREAINKEFKSRCAELLEFVYKNKMEKEAFTANMLKSANLEISKIILNYKNSLKDLTEEEAKDFYKKNTISFDSYLQTMKSSVCKELKGLWISNKEVI